MANMPSYEEITEKQFDALVKKVFHDERIDFMRSMWRQMNKQSLFSELPEESVLNFEDVESRKAFDDVDTEFQVLKYSVSVHSALLCDALLQIDERERNIILMAFWLNMSDQEIADETGLKRRTVNDIRNKTYQKLRKILEDDGYETSRF
jgi:RNA polymerase sigma factor (sigma-70 family)